MGAPTSPRSKRPCWFHSRSHCRPLWPCSSGPLRSAVWGSTHRIPRTSKLRLDRRKDLLWLSLGHLPWWIPRPCLCEQRSPPSWHSCELWTKNPRPSSEDLPLRYLVLLKQLATDVIWQLNPLSTSRVASGLQGLCRSTSPPSWACSTEWYENMIPVAKVQSRPDLVGVDVDVDLTLTAGHDRCQAAVWLPVPPKMPSAVVYDGSANLESELPGTNTPGDLAR